MKIGDTHKVGSISMKLGSENRLAFSALACVHPLEEIYRNERCAKRFFFAPFFTVTNYW